MLLSFSRRLRAHQRVGMEAEFELRRAEAKVRKEEKDRLKAEAEAAAKDAEDP